MVCLSSLKVQYQIDLIKNIHCRNIFKAIDFDDLNRLLKWIEAGYVNDDSIYPIDPLTSAVGKNKPEFVRIILESGGETYSQGDIIKLAVDTWDDNLKKN